jgi:REP element-mobilizing transposase RayT
MSTQVPLQPGQFYHIYNRGINGATIFREARNYRYFLKKYAYHVTPIAKTYAYCLMPNHFHLLVAMRMSNLEGSSSKLLTAHRYSRAFANLFSGYAKAINQAHERTGSLFERGFHRIPVDTDRYFQHLVCYIHQNPAHHGFVADFRAWPHSSYVTLQSHTPTHLEREFVLEQFGGRDAVQQAHHVDTSLPDTLTDLSFETNVDKDL